MAESGFHRFQRFVIALGILLGASAVASAQMERLPATELGLAEPIQTDIQPDIQLVSWEQEIEPGPPQPFLDLDAHLANHSVPVDYETVDYEPVDYWMWQLLPDGLIYRPYLAGPKESRFSTHLINETDDDLLWDATLGTQVGLLRWGSHDRVRPVGFQIDAEGSAQLRLDIPSEVDVRSVDFRAGVPFTFGYGRTRTKFAYYHLSSHLGDEFLLKNPTFERLNYSRDVLVLGHSIYLTDEIRVYGEAGWAYYTRVGKEWEFQFGMEYAPLQPTGLHGAPFFAINGQMREELNFGGGLTVQAGWAWRGIDNAHMLRAGMHYYNGDSTQYSFFNRHEQQIGFGLWYDM